MPKDIETVDIEKLKFDQTGKRIEKTTNYLGQTLQLFDAPRFPIVIFGNSSQYILNKSIEFIMSQLEAQLKY
jgi:hypothetical protein